jgi:cysteine synthase B
VGLFFCPEIKHMYIETNLYKLSPLQSQIEQLGKQIGDTPLLSFRNISPNPKVELWAKAEWKQASGSVKARAAYYIIRDAIQKGFLYQGKTLLDASSGNTAIAYAYLAKELGISVTICLPENASPKRKEILKSLGANLILTSKFGGTDDAQEAAQALATAQPERYFYADQYKNPNNLLAHYQGTALEILKQQPFLTHFIAGLGTTGTFTGTATRLRETHPHIQLVSLQPDLALHGLEGWKHLETALVPSIYNPTLADLNLEIATEDAFRTIEVVKKKEGFLLSPSAAANITGALKIAQEIDQGILITLLPDSVERYPEIQEKFK